MNTVSSLTRAHQDSSKATLIRFLPIKTTKPIFFLKKPEPDSNQSVSVRFSFLMLKTEKTYIVF